MGNGRREGGYDTGGYGSTILIIWRVFHRYHVGVLHISRSTQASISSLNAAILLPIL